MPGKGPAAIGMAMLNATVGAYNRTYSPIALSQEWSRTSRLLFMAIICVFGTFMNVLYLVSFFVEKNLSKKDNVFMALLGFADLMITAGVMSVSTVVLLSGQWDTPDVCRILQFTTEVSTYSYTFFFMLSAMVNFCHHNCQPCHTRKFVNIMVNIGVPLVYIASVTASIYGVYSGYDYDYCQRLHYGYYKFRVYTSIFFYCVPCIITVIFLIATTLNVKERGLNEAYYGRSQRYDDEYSRVAINFLAYFLYLLAWMPYLIIINQNPTTSDSKYYKCAWLGISRSVVTSILYCTLDNDFRRASGYFFTYCFCKRTVSSSYYSRNRRARDKPIIDVGLNVLTQALNPQRSASASRSRETIEL